MTEGMWTRTLPLVLLFGACDSSAGGEPAPKKSVPAKAAMDAPPKVDAKAEAELIANAPPEGEIVDEKKPADPAAGEGADVLTHEVKLLDGTVTNLDAYKGKALLVVNTASECGYTPQYEDLQTVYKTYRDRGFEVLAFPSNDYGSQEPGGPEEIRKFVDENYSVEFPVFDKVVVKGPDKAPLFKSLTEQADESMKGEVRWNFTKFLIDPTGKVVGRFEPKIKPTDPEVIEAIERVLPKGA